MKLRLIWTVLFPLLACVGCGSNLVKGESPFVSISGMSLSEQSLSIGLNIRNINDLEMNINSINVTLQAGAVEIARYVQPLRLVVDRNATEEALIEVSPGPRTRELLDALSSGERQSIAFELQGKVRTMEDGLLDFKHEGHLYPVPGRPGQFRSASTRTREPR